MAQECALSIVEKMGGALVVLIWEQFTYLLDYESNIENLRNEVESLVYTRDGVQLAVNAARMNLQVIGPIVEAWLRRVDDVQGEAAGVLEGVERGCFNGWCPNLWSRYFLSKRAKENTRVVVGLRAEGNNYSSLSYPAPPLGIESIPTGNIKEFESRKSREEEIMAALKDGNINLIGICGMGGVGKTTMVEAIGKRAKEENLFDEVVMAVVSQEPDLKKIQCDIAGWLGLTLGEQSLLQRAGLLSKRIKKATRILVIFDDVWARLNLKEVGIPCGDEHKGCKIVLTSRSDDVCGYASDDVNSQKKITIGVLTKEESWNLFMEMAGISIDPTDPNSTERRVEKECGRLPLAIVTVGRALRHKSNLFWEDALRQLRNSIGKNIRGVNENVFSSLELSYNYLPSDEAKKFFLLCSLFPEDFNIPIEDLVMYGMGLNLFKDIDGMGDGRIRVHALVNELKGCYLLLDGRRSWNEQDHFRMHDVVRDVAISIASRDEHGFLVRCDKAWKEWPNRDYFAISLRCTAMHKLPLDLECPKLQLLWLVYGGDLPETPNSFYGKMNSLKVLALLNMSATSLLQSLRFLTDLRTLSLKYCRLEDVSAIGELKKLEILSLEGSTVKELPTEIGQLLHLKLLDLTYSSIIRICPGVISSLSNLEELYMGDTFEDWEIVEEGKERTNASLDELTSLSNLITLHVKVTNAQSLLKSGCLEDMVFGSLERFQIILADDPHCHGFFIIEGKMRPNRLVVQMNKRRWRGQSGLSRMLKKTEMLSLSGVMGLENVFNTEGFAQLKQLSLSFCDGEYLNDTTYGNGVPPQSPFPKLESLVLRELYNLKGICHQPLPKEAFGALTELWLFDLPALTHLWKGPTQIAQLRNLKSLWMSNCDQLEYLTADTSMDLLQQTQSAFPKLEQLKLEHLKNLKGICHQPLPKEAFGALIRLHLVDLPALMHFWKGPTQLYKLVAIEVLNCPKLEYLIAEDMQVTLTSVEEISVSKRDNLMEIFHGQLPTKIRKMTVRECHSWNTFPSNIIKCLQNLEELRVEGCDSLGNLFSSCIAKHLVNLQKLVIIDCSMMQAVVASEREEDEVTTNVIMFPQLKHLQLDALPNLLNFCPKPNNFEVTLASVEEISVSKIDNLMEIFHGQLPTKIRKMTVREYHSWNTFPSNIIKCLQNL